MGRRSQYCCHRLPKRDFTRLMPTMVSPQALKLPVAACWAQCGTSDSTTRLINDHRIPNMACAAMSASAIRRCNHAFEISTKLNVISMQTLHQLGLENIAMQQTRDSCPFCGELCTDGEGYEVVLTEVPCNDLTLHTVRLFFTAAGGRSGTS